MRKCVGALALAMLVSASGAAASETYVLRGEVERRSPGDVAEILLGSVAERTIGVAWDDIEWTGYPESTLKLMRPLEATPNVRGLCHSTVTLVDVFREARAVRRTPGRPADALRVSGLRTQVRYQVIGEIAEVDGPGDAGCARFGPAPHAFVSNLDFGALLRATKALELVLADAGSASPKVVGRCTTSEQALGDPCQYASKTLATLDTRRIVSVAAVAEGSDAIRAVLAGPQQTLWSVVFTSPTARDTLATLPREVLVEPEDRIVLTGPS